MRKFILLSVLLCFGCAANRVATKDTNVNIRTRVSNHFYLEPVQKGEKFVLVKIANQTTKQKGFSIDKRLIQDLEGRGYQVVQYPDKANLIVQGKVIQAGEMEPEVLKAAYNTRFGTNIRMRKRQSKDLFVKTIGLIAGKVQHKSYGIIFDMQVKQIQRTESLGRKVSKNKTRIVSGIHQCKLQEDEAGAMLEKDLLNHITALF